MDANSLSITINPPHPIPLAGYGNRLGNYKSIHDSIEANVMLIKDQGTVCVLITIDALFATTALKESILDQVQSSNLSTDNVFLFASHTHFAPALDQTKPLLGLVDRDYLNDVTQKIAQAIQSLLKSESKSVSIHYTQTSAKHAVNRRVTLRSGQVKLAVNRSGDKDESIHLLKCIDSDGQLQSILWSYACHPVCFPDRSRVSSDYIGVVRDAIRNLYRNDQLPVLFLQGFSGDIRPNSPDFSIRSLFRWARHGAQVFKRMSVKRFDCWSHSLSRIVTSALESAPFVEQDSSLDIATNRIPIQALLETSDTPAIQDKDLTTVLIKFGTSLCICGISAEVTSSYRHYIKQWISSDTIIPVGCMDSVFGYLPSKTMLGTGGYEDLLFGPAFSIGTIVFNQDIETKLRTIITSE